MVFNWIIENYKLIQLIGFVSLALFLLSIFLLRYVILKLPEDYFLRLKSIPQNQAKSFKGVVSKALKNLFGILLVICGVILLFIPGQGLVTIVMGLCLSDLPFLKKWKEKFIFSNKIKIALNWLRSKKRVKPFIFTES